MRVFKMNSETRAAMVAALRSNAANDLLLAGLGRVRSHDGAYLTSIAIEDIAAGEDGLIKIELSDVAGLIAWRAFAISECNAERGRYTDLQKYKDLLGIEETEPAFSFVKVAIKGSGMRLCDDYTWSHGAEWVIRDGNVPDPRKKFASSAWRARAMAHEVCAARGLTLPMTSTWKPRATILFRQPKLYVPPVRFELTAADEFLLEEMAT